MNAFNFRPITLTTGGHESAGQAPEVAASLATCTNCNGELFLLIQVGDHAHFQCHQCGMSFCQGNCESPAVLNREN